MSRIKSVLAVALAAVAVAVGARADETRVAKLRRAMLGEDRTYVFVALHRGDWRHHPENSLSGVKGAIALGADIIEVDASRTKDGRYVLMHDATVDRTTTGKGKVADKTLAELKDLRLKKAWGGRGRTGIVTDERVPTLEEVLEAARGQVLINIDKFDQNQEEIMALLRRMGMEDHILLKGNGYPEAVRAAMGAQWGAVADGTLVYMPVVWDDAEGLAKYDAWWRATPRPKMFEIVLNTYGPYEILDRARAGGARIWINTMADWLCNGHTDDGDTLDPTAGWRWCLEQGATMIQTDAPYYCIRYLESIGRHTLK